MTQTSVNTAEVNKIEERFAGLATAEEGTSPGESFFDALSQGSVKRVLFLACDAAAVVLSNWVSLPCRSFSRFQGST